MSRPRWIIDDTSESGRIFCEHTQFPRLVGELLPYDDAPDRGIFFHAPDDRLLCVIRWLEDTKDGVYYEVQDMTKSLIAAIQEHQAAKQSRH